MEDQSSSQYQEADLEQAWWSVVGELQPNQRAWLEASAPVTLHGNQAIIEVVDEFTRGQLEGRLRAQIEEGLTAVFGREIRLGVTVNPQLVSERAAVPPNAPESHHVDNSTHLPVDTSTYGRVWGWASPRRARLRAGPLGARDPAEPEVHLRHLRHRLVQPLPPRGRRRGRRGPGPRVQPAARLRRLRAGQDPPAPRDRPLRAQPLQRGQGALRVERGVHQRVHQRDPRRPAGPVQAEVPRRRRAADRRHPVPGGQDPDPGGVLPHLQHPPQRQQADRAHLRPRRPSASRPSRTGCATGSSGD